MDLSELLTEKLIKVYLEIVNLLKERQVIRSKKLIGNLEEYLVISYYNTTPGLPNLQAVPTGTQNVDALSRQGDRYSIKATTVNLTGVFYGLQPPASESPYIQKFEFANIVCIDNTYRLKRIIELTWEQFYSIKNGTKP
ncbi:hypothetical protein [Chryseobacterium sp. T20]|uniref:hypothetical protein n=1 Tax=Chryseobacterium sp. T20 TaxID=3395375 RepID=UPI0039BD48EE